MSNHVIVPITPTLEMQQAGARAAEESADVWTGFASLDAKTVYCAMIAAAPARPVPENVNADLAALVKRFIYAARDSSDPGIRSLADIANDYMKRKGLWTVLRTTEPAAPTQQEDTLPERDQG